MMQNCRLRFSLLEESISRFQTQFSSFTKSKILRLKDFEVGDDRISSILMSFLTLWLLCLLLVFFFSWSSLSHECAFFCERVSSLRSKRGENVTKSECRMRTIDELKHLIISNWRDREGHFSINKRRLIENFLNNLILLSSSLTTARWKGEK